MSEVVFHTSGSTGAAKRIVRTEEDLTADAAAIVSAFPEVWRDGPLVVASVREEHLYGALWCVRAPACANGSVWPSLVLSVEELVAVAEKGRKFLFVTTPSFLERALEHPLFAGLRGSFHAIVTSGSPLRNETALAVERTVGICPLEIYGSTETGTLAWRRQNAGAAWTLVPAVTARATPEGCLLVDSPFAIARPYALNDLVSFVGPRQFVLKGRADRLVKVLEQFVSLNRVEEVLSQHPFVSQARAETTDEGVPRIGVLLVASEAGRAALAGGTFFSVAARLRADLRGELDRVAWPRRIRFVHRLPTDERGKTTVRAVRDALAATCPEPVVMAWSATADRLETQLVFPPDMTCFDGHFPGFPVLPGVAQLLFLRHFARSVFADFPDACTYCKLKFRKVITPGSRACLTVERCAPGRFAFSLGEAASGEVVAK